MGIGLFKKINLIIQKFLGIGFICEGDRNNLVSKTFTPPQHVLKQLGLIQ
jgi:hypothetical protein